MRRACGSRGRSQLHLSLSQTPPAGARVPGRHMGLSRWGVHDARSREVLQPLCDRSDASDAQAQLIMASARSPGLIVSCSVVGPFLAAPSAWRSRSFPQVLFSGISHRHSCAEMTRKVAVDSSSEDVNRRVGRLRRHTGEESGLTAWSRRRRLPSRRALLQTSSERRCAGQGPRAHRADPLWRSRSAVRPRAPAWRQKVQSVIAASSSPRRETGDARDDEAEGRAQSSEYRSENRSAQSSYSNPPPVFPSLHSVLCL